MAKVTLCTCVPLASSSSSLVWFVKSSSVLVLSLIHICSYQESIAQHIMLLILSHHGEVIGREDFGSMIWDLEFNQLVKISDWEEGVKNP